ncbi:MAG: hypothetical protein ACFE7R_09550 [Candidatus Hodarchaeota archaeon]
MYRRTPHAYEEEKSDFLSTSSPGVLFSIRSMTSLLSDFPTQNINRMSLHRYQQALANSVEALWRDVHSGRVLVDSIALLRALRDIARNDLAAKIREPVLDSRRIIRELRLFENTLRHVVKPIRRY